MTDKGLDLLPMLVEMIAWSGRHDPDTSVPATFLERAAHDREALIAELRERAAA